MGERSGDGIMAKTLTFKINDSAHRRLMAMQERKRLPLGELIAYLVNQERKRELQKEADKEIPSVFSVKKP
jgi:hypothetical protein